MANEEKPRMHLVMTPLAGYLPEIGTWLWALEEVRHGLLLRLEGLDQQTLDWRGPGGDENSIGSLLYHIALVEMSWLYEDILLEAEPADIAELFALPHRAPDGRLAHVPEVPLAEHLARLSLTRQRLLERLKAMTLADWHTERTPPGVDYHASPAWTIFHLVEHEAGHAFQIRALKTRALRASGTVRPKAG